MSDEPVDGSVAGSLTVVGLGGAGNRMLATVADRFDDADLETATEFVAVDSSEHDLQQYAPSDAEQIYLHRRDTLFDLDRENRPYLNESDRFPDVGGAARSRGVGRYHLDSDENVDHLVAALEGAIEEAISEAPLGNRPHYVWLLHALGGGTGSGIMPLVSALVQDITAKRDDDVVVCGVGSLPRLDALESSAIRPPGSVSLYVNAYTALRELAVLLDYDDEGVYPLAIDVEANAEAITGDELTVRESPFDAYGLVGASEDLISDGDYVAGINRLVADTVYAFATTGATNGTTGLQRFGLAGDGMPLQGERLFSLDGTTVSAPVDGLRDYVDLGEEIAELEADIAELEGDRKALEWASRYLEDLLWWPESDELPVPDSAIRHLEAMANDVETFARGHHTIDTALDDLPEALDVPELVDADEVGIYLATSIMEQELVERLRDHDLHRGLAMTRDAYDIDAPAGTNDDLEAALSVWETVDRALEQRLEGLEAEADRTTFNVLKRFELDRRLEETTEEYERLADLAADYERLVDYRRELRKRHRETEDRLQNRRDELRNRQTTKRDERERLESTRDSREVERESLAGVLREPRLDTFDTRLPIADPERVDSEMLSDIGNLADLAEYTQLDIETVDEALEDVPRRLSEPVQDRQTSAPKRTFSYLTVLATASNHAFVENRRSSMDRDPFDTSSDGPFDALTTAAFPDPYTVRLLAVYAPIHLERTSEFGTLHEYYTDPDRDLTEQFGTTITDDDVTAQFAYPELVDAAGEN